VPRQQLDKDEKISPEAEFISDEADYLQFLDRLYIEEGIDLAQYKQNQMRRRLNMMLKQHSMTTYCDFLDYAKAHEDVYRRFIDRITINVSEFLRDPEKYKILEEKYLKPLLASNSSPVIWSAGCSTGEEPYSLALLLRRHNASPAARIIGWDFDRGALEFAQTGVYQADSLKHVSPADLSEHFTLVDPTHYQVNSELKALVHLEKHNLLEDIFPGNIDLILCRNVVIYFSETAKRSLFNRLGAALGAAGVLMIGNSERIPNAEQVGLVAIEPHFYARQDSVHHKHTQNR
jgi:chemotaxis protein methyltransferase CheR